jgi:hypothetical protein
MLRSKLVLAPATPNRSVSRRIKVVPAGPPPPQDDTSIAENTAKSLVNTFVSRFISTTAL